MRILKEWHMVSLGLMKCVMAEGYLSSAVKGGERDNARNCSNEKNGGRVLA